MYSYVVRCNFSKPAKEGAWNDWYSGPKIGQMLAKPYFRTCQRFRRSIGSGRNYLALWTVESTLAFETPEYKSDWGFFEWKPYIIDWSRDIFTAPNIADETFAVSPHGALHVVSFDGVDAAAAQRGQKAFSFVYPKMLWLKVAGLDRHSLLIGFEVLPELPQSWRPSDAYDGAQEALYIPISDFHSAGKPASAKAVSTT